MRIRSLDLGHLVEYGLERGPEYDGVMDLPKAAIERMGVPTGIDVDIASDAPPGSGLGVPPRWSPRAWVRSRCSRALDGAPRGRRARVRDRARGPRHRGRWQDQFAAAFGGFNLLEFDQGGATVHPLALAPRPSPSCGRTCCSATPATSGPTSA